MNVSEWLGQATLKLQRAGIASARLDAELLAGHLLRKNRTFVHAHGNDSLSAATLHQLNELLQKRADHQPLAYLLGYKEFFGHVFTVTPDTLIPRPETESLVEQVLKLPLAPHSQVVDIGTGSGAIAISLALGRPDLHIFARDISPEALRVAQYNAQNLKTSIDFKLQDLLEGEPHGPFAAIVANLPYVNESWQRSPETAFEPDGALFADDGGLALIAELLRQAPKRLAPKGFVVLEADPRQHKPITSLAAAQGLRPLIQQDFAIIFTN